MTNAAKTKEWLQIGAYLIIAFVIYKIYKGVSGGLTSIGEGLGIVDTVEEKQAKEENKQTLDREESKGVESCFSADYWTKKILSKKKNEVISLDSYTLAMATAKAIYNSVGTFYDSPERAVKAFAGLKNKLSVSMVCYYFEERKGIPLIQFLDDKFDTGYQAKCLTKIIEDANKLPIGLKTGTKAELAAWAKIRAFLQQWTGLKLPA